LSHDEIRRYSRHLIMPEVGLEGQIALKGARVLLVGAGGLGSPAAMYLAAAGVGTIGIVDPDVVDETNLQRQVVHGTPDLGRAKIASAGETIQAINPLVQVEGHEVHLSSANALELLAGYDIVVDGTDNFPTRYLVNDACVMLGKPNVYGSIYRFDGQATVFAHEHAGERGPCYRCLFPAPPPPGTVPSCAEGGVLGVLPGVIGLIQATEAIKLILGRGEPLVGRLLLYDALAMRTRELRIRRDPHCPVCGDQPSIHDLIDYEAFCGLPAQGQPVALFEDEIEPAELAARIEQGEGEVEGVIILDVREAHEHAINRIPHSRLVPLHDLHEQLGTLDPTREIVVLCLVGQRSANACRLLRDAGFTRVRNLRGGIRAWIDEVDPTLPRY
jgi:adenylyltransferase/sulfurtransferase